MSDIEQRSEAALEGVSDGPWETRDGFVYPLSIRYGLGGIWERDAQFIAAARTLVPELLAELKASRAQNEQRTITTDAELDALPFLAVVREKFSPSPGSGCDYGGIWERRTSGWQCLAGSLMPPGYTCPHLPAAVLWEPK